MAGSSGAAGTVVDMGDGGMGSGAGRRSQGDSGAGEGPRGGRRRRAWEGEDDPEWVVEDRHNDEKNDFFNITGWFSDDEEEDGKSPKN